MGAIIDFLVLLPKDSSDWSVIPGEAVGYLFYTIVAPEFGYSFAATGLEADTEYCLIYYADKPDRFVDWGGNNPGALIGNFTADGGGNVVAEGWTELNMSLPHSNDANVNEYVYNLAPDYYAHPCGAKIWLVPADCYDEPEVVSWTPSRFLFETDLICYIDTGE